MICLISARSYVSFTRLHLNCHRKNGFARGPSLRVPDIRFEVLEIQIDGLAFWGDICPLPYQVFHMPVNMAPGWNGIANTTVFLDRPCERALREICPPNDIWNCSGTY